MRRLSIAFALALFFHLLLSLIPWSRQRQALPQPTGGDTSIAVNLADTAARNRPAEIPMPETTGSKIPLARPLEKIKQPVAVTTLKPRVKKTVPRGKPAPAALGSSIAEKVPVPSTAIQTGPTSPKAPSVSKPALIKARPLYDQNPKPPYPPLARKRGWQGVVILSVMVLEDGSPARLSVKKSCGHDLLDKTALATVQKWHFLPGTKNNVPTSMEVLVPVHFLLQ